MDITVFYTYVLYCDNLNGAMYHCRSLVDDKHDIFLLAAFPAKPILTLKTQGTLKTLTCSGDVGKPPQNFTWLLYKRSDDDFLPLNLNSTRVQIAHEMPMEDRSRCQFTYDFTAQSAAFCKAKMRPIMLISMFQYKVRFSSKIYRIS